MAKAVSFVKPPVAQEHSFVFEGKKEVQTNTPEIPIFFEDFFIIRSAGDERVICF